MNICLSSTELVFGAFTSGLISILIYVFVTRFLEEL
jgi:hypothetical protein